ncbi:hypothetical protein NQ318_017440 [Aromia moschata]|uniref:Uncharacterized protein n=1 Tax=Aromia moschata TaxID=1265417 RepID=A0AAV8Z489_9CUCU|nr:hypothetical protein NQ318_017440 [Aromia moschata]
MIQFVNRSPHVRAIQQAEYGIPWKTWNTIEIYHLGNSHLPEGRWGNPKSNCLLFRKLGICEYADGPVGVLRKKRDFYCWTQ